MNDTNKKKIEETIKVTENGDVWECTCGNSDDPGFYNSDIRGHYIEPDIGSGWERYYTCHECFNIIDAEDGYKIVGCNPNAFTSDDFHARGWGTKGDMNYLKEKYEGLKNVVINNLFRE